MVVPLDVRAVGIGVAQYLGKELQDGVFVVGFGEGHGGSPHVFIDCSKYVFIFVSSKLYSLQISS